MQKRYVWGVLFQVLLTLLLVVVIVRMVMNFIDVLRLMRTGHEGHPAQLFTGLGTPLLGMLAVYVWNLADVWAAGKWISKKAAGQPD